MAWVNVPNTKINSLFNRPWRVPERDVDGDPIFPQDSPPGDMKACETCGHLNKEPRTRDATTYDIMLEIILAHSSSPVIKQLHKAIDGQRVARLWNQIDRGKGQDFLKIRKEEYDWLHGLLARKVPWSRENKEHLKDSGIEEKTVANLIFSGSDWTIIEQVKSMEERDYELRADRKAPEDEPAQTAQEA